MMDSHHSGGLGLLLLAGAAALLLAVRRFLPPPVSKVILLAGVLVLLAVGALVLLVVFLAFRKPGKAPAPKQQKEQNEAELLRAARSQLLEARQLTLRLRDKPLRKAGEEVCGSMERILGELKDSPEDFPKARQLFTSYLPAFRKILRRYVRLEQSGVPAEEQREQVLACLTDIQKAMEKLYGSLFDGDKLDLSVEMEVLRRLCRQDGLLAGCEAEEGEAEKAEIRLTL